MSSTFSDLVASALLDHCRGVSTNEKYLLRDVLGVSPVELYAAVAERAGIECTIEIGEGRTYDLFAVELQGGVKVIPYLVLEGSGNTEDPNRGNRGFNGRLRDWFDRGVAEGEVRILVTFDDSPIETQKTAMEEGLAATLFTPERLLGYVRGQASAGASHAVRPLLQAVIAFATDQVPARDAYAIAALTRFVREAAPFGSVAEVGERLLELPWLLRDPEIELVSAGRRMRDARTHRSRLDKWAALPEYDFDDEVRSHYKAELAQKLIAQRRLGWVQWQHFTLSEILGGLAGGPNAEPLAKNALSPLDPATSSKATVTVTRELGDNDYGLALLTESPDCELEIHVERQLLDRETIHVIPYVQAGGGFVKGSATKHGKADVGETDTAVLGITLTPLDSGWAFFDLVLTEGANYVKNYLGRIRVAALVNPRLSELPYERRCMADPTSQAFVCDDEAEIETRDRDGNVRGIDADPDPEGDGSTSQCVAVEVGGERVLIPVLAEVEDPEAPTSNTRDELSAEHAMLRSAAVNGSDLAPVQEPRLSFVRGHARVASGTEELHLQEFPALGTSRWRLERAILEHPEFTAYRVQGDGVIPDPRLENLSMQALEPEFGKFMAARRRFFAALLTTGRGSRATMLASDLASMPEASEYTGAYASVLGRIPNGENWRAEYERILLVDAVAVAEQDEYFLAPSSPLAVALHAEFQRSIGEWEGNSCSQLLGSDVDLISPRYALPLLKIEDRWCESAHAPYPWRMYSPLSAATPAAPEPFVPGFVARRIQAFLSVHPAYRDEGRTLVLAFVNPGGGGHIRDALLRVVREAERKKTGLGAVPRFEVKLFTSGTDTDDRSIGSELDTFMTEAQEIGSPSWLEQELMQRLTYTKERLPDYLNNQTAFAHIAFIENYFRPDHFQSYAIHDRTSSSFAAGMAADLARDVEVAPNEVVFTNGVWLGHGLDDTVATRLVGRSLEVLAAAEGDPVEAGKSRGLVTRVGKAELPKVYERCVWVVHLDRHIGLELFYPQAQGGATPYILDHTDQENIQESGFDGITATGMVSPYLARIRSAFEPLAGMDESRAERMLRWLNVLSGRWALELLRASPTELRERLGAVVAFRFLVDRELAFEDPNTLSVVISLDELLRVTSKEGLPIHQGWAHDFGHKGEASDDFLLLRMPFEFDTEPQLTARLIEVKYSETGAQNEKAWRQLVATHRLLSAMFEDPALPGRLFRGRALSKIVQAYISRMRAYGLLAPEITSDPRLQQALDSVAAGRFGFDPTFWRDGERLIGDFVSVEPKYSEPVFAGSAFPEVPREDAGQMGRIRIGEPLIEALISENKQEAQAGSYSMPAYEEGARPAPRAPVPVEPETPVEPPPPEVVDPSGTEIDKKEDQGPERQTDDQPATPPPDPQPITSLTGRFQLPHAELQRQADKLDQAFSGYGLPVEPFDPSLSACGPNVIRFMTRMARAGTIAQIESRTRDLQREMGIQHPIYVGQRPPYVVVDLPREQRAVITFEDVQPAFGTRQRSPGELLFVLGVDAAGQIEIGDLADMPHLLVAGSTGSGKSVFLSTIATSLAACLPPERLELVIVDVKGLDFAHFADLPHLRGGRIIEDPNEAVTELENLIGGEVEERRKLLRHYKARQLLELYAVAPESEWPAQIVVMIDEYAQLVTASGRSRSQLESLVQQYAQFARSFGIYLVLSTQRPSADVITGKIKANLPARCVFQLPSFNDSRTVIDVGGAEKLLGSGDMLLYRDGSLERYQAVLTTPSDIQDI